MNNVLNNKIINRILMVALIVSVFFGHKAIVNTQIFGVTPTYFRVITVLSTIYYFLIRIKNKVKVEKLPKLFWLFAIMMLFWFFYGLVQIFFSPYTTFAKGLPELLSIFMSLLLVYCVYEFCLVEGNYKFFLNLIRIIMMGYVIFGLFEICTGYHLADSRFTEETLLNHVRDNLFGAGSEGIIIIFHYATINAFNENTICAMLGMFLPLFFIDNEMSTLKKIVYLVCIALIGVIIGVDNSFIPVIGIGLGLMVYLILSKEKVLNWILSFAFFAFVQQVFTKWVNILLLKINTIISPDKYTGKFYHHTIDYYNINQILEKELRVSQSNPSKSSTMLRVELYKDAFQMTFATFLLGVGPGGFANYLSVKYPKSPIYSPHNWWLEVLSQYGIFVFAFYVGILIYSLFSLIRKFLKEKNMDYLRVIAMSFSFVIAVVAPSGMIYMPFQWIVVALCLVSLEQDKIRKNVIV